MVAFVRHPQSLDRPSRPLKLLQRPLLCLGLLLLWPSLATSQAFPRGDEFAVNSFTTGLQEYNTVASAADGSFVVVWQSEAQDGDAAGLVLRHFDALGNPTDDEVQINQFTTQDQTDPDITRLLDGTFVVVWDSDLQDGDARGIFGRRFDATGQPQGDEFLVNTITTGDQNDAVVAAGTDGGFLVAWEDLRQPPFGEDVVVRRFDAAGQGVGVEMQVNNFSVDDQEDIDLAADGSGGFVVSWESELQDGSYDSVVVRRLDATGTPVGDEQIVNTFTTGDQDTPDIAVAPDGSFVVTWEDDTADSLVDAVFGRWFDAGGTPTTGAFQIDGDPGRQMNPRVAIDSQGRAVVVWDSLGQDAAASIGVVLNVFDGAGTPLSSEQIVNTTVDGDQFYPHLALDAEDRFLVVWESSSSDGSDLGLVARRYELAFFADGFESGDTTAWSSVTP